MKALSLPRSVTAQQLAQESGFRSYSTFSAAFKKHRGYTVAEWMNSTKTQPSIT